MGEPLYKPGMSFVITIAEVYASCNKENGKRSADYVYRMKGAIPLMREGQLKLLERIQDERND